MVRHESNFSELWQKIPWRKLRRELFRLQTRLFKAIRDGDKKRARNLQKLILKSKAARLLALRQVTQLNAGKKTAGVEGVKSLNFKERFELAKELEGVMKWKHSKLREIPIPKKDGTIRLLKVPTIKDRAWQCLVKYAVEPAHERINHSTIMERLIAPMTIEQGLYAGIKAGVNLELPEQGTPQGGVISPLSHPQPE